MLAPVIACRYESCTCICPLTQSRNNQLIRLPCVLLDLIIKLKHCMQHRRNSIKRRLWDGVRRFNHGYGGILSAMDSGVGGVAT